MSSPRAFRASRAAARRSRPSSNSNSAKLARTPATMRPRRIGWVDALAQRPKHGVPLPQFANRRHNFGGVVAQWVNANDDDGIVGTGVVQERGESRTFFPRRHSRQLFAVDPLRIHASVGESVSCWSSVRRAKGFLSSRASAAGSPASRRFGSRQVSDFANPLSGRRATSHTRRRGQPRRRSRPQNPRPWSTSPRTHSRQGRHYVHI
jgi:hypothetical protein